MYAAALVFHSLFRWLVLVSLCFAIFIAFRGWIGGRKYLPFDNRVRHITATIAHIQLILGIALYSISPFIRYFLCSYSEAIHKRQIRFFGMEHSLMMLVSILLITIGSASAKRKTTDRSKFKTMALWYTVALIIIVVNIPWPFSPMVSRPLFRLF